LSTPPADPQSPPSIALDPVRAGVIRLRIGGRWRLDQDVPTLTDTAELIDQGRAAAGPGAKSVGFTISELSSWDSALVTFIAGVDRLCRERDLDCDASTLPDGLRRLLEMARAVPPAPQDERPDRGPTFLTRVGLDVADLVRSTGEIMTFFGEGALAVRRFVLGRARYRRSELWVIIQESGADALPIVSLVSFLVGMILGYIGDQQLAQFGARIYVADLVGLATVIQMGALITGIVLAGRTGAAFAARIGTMQVNEEIDALRTFGIPPMEFLVLPRMIALILMTPLLTLYADLLGILGGAFVGTAVGGLTLTAYLVQTQAAIGWNHIIQGLISATVYGAIVAASGCLRGMQCGRSAAAVGEATTSAVVTAIVFIVIAAAVLTVIFDAIGLSG
jgi:phospholipid/cholesterol/gamma-HCH transport system permease protein